MVLPFGWDIATTLAPSQIANFRFYIEVERDVAISSFWVNGSPAAVPEASTATLLALSLAGLARRRGLHCR